MANHLVADFKSKQRSQLNIRIGAAANMNKDAASAATKRRFGRSQPTSLANAPSERMAARKVALFALGRLKPGEMNRTEQAYAQHLELRKQAGEVAWFRFEAIKLRLADNAFSLPISLCF